MDGPGEYEDNEAGDTESFPNTQKLTGNSSDRPGTAQEYGHVKDRSQSIHNVHGDQEFQPPVIVRTGVLELVVICFFTGLEIYYPLIQQYVYGRLLREHSHDVDPNEPSSWLGNNSSGRKECSNISGGAREERAQKDSAQWLLYIGLSNVIPGVFSTLILGSIIDVKGRKLGMIIPSVGAIIKTGITSLVIKFNWPLYVLLICGFIDGCLGSFGTTFTAAFAYLADITAPGKQRTWRITVLEALMGVVASGVSVGVGFFINACGFFYPMALSVGLFVLNIILIVFCLPETVKSRSGVPILSIGRLFKSVATYLKPREGTRRIQLIFMLLAYLVVQMVVISKGVVGTLFQLGMPFCWRSVKLGIYSGVGTVVQTVSMLTLLRPFTMCMHENIVCMIGILSTIGELTVFGLSINDVMMFLAPVVGFFILIPGAMIKSVSSDLVDEEEHGSLFAGLSSVQLLCFGFGSSIFNYLYGQTVASFPGLVFLVMAGVVFIPLLLIGIAEALRRKDAIRPGYQSVQVKGD